jgi:hypothetical protein
MLALQSEVHGTHSLGGVTAILLLRCSLFSLRPEARVLPDFKTIYGTCLHGSGRGAAVRPRYKGLTPKAAVAGGPARTAGFRSSAPRLRDRDLLLDAEMEHEDSRRPPRSLGGGPGDAQWMTAGRGIVHSEMPSHGTEPVLVGRLPRMTATAMLKSPS